MMEKAGVQLGKNISFAIGRLSKSRSDACDLASSSLAQECILIMMESGTIVTTESFAAAIKYIRKRDLENTNMK